MGIEREGENKKERERERDSGRRALGSVIANVYRSLTGRGAAEARPRNLITPNVGMDIDYHSDPCGSSPLPCGTLS